SEPGSATDSVDTPATNVSVVVTASQRVRLEALPQVVQHGSQVASADAAQAAVTATLPPGGGGRRVQLQVRRGETWEVVATRRQDGRGRAQFATAASVDGDPLTYRVKA